MPRGAMVRQEETRWTFDPSRRLRVLSRMIMYGGIAIPGGVVATLAAMGVRDMGTLIPAIVASAVFVIAGLAVHLIFVRGGAPLLVDTERKTLHRAGRDAPWSSAGPIVIWRSVGARNQERGYTNKPAFGVGVVVAGPELLVLSKACGPEAELRTSAKQVAELWGSRVLTLDPTTHGELPSLAGRKIRIGGRAPTA